MAKIKEEDLRLNIIINGDGGRKKMLDLKTTIEQTKAKTAQLIQEQEKLRASGQSSSAQYKKNESDLKHLDATLQESSQQYQALQRKMKLTGMTLSELRQHLKLTKIALSHAVPDTANWKKLQAEVQATQARIKELNAGTQSTSLAAKAGKAAGVIAAATAAIAGLSRVVKGVAGKIAEFEQANVDLSTILGKNVSEIEGLTSSAKTLGRTTEYTASQVTLLQTELAKLGFNESQITAMQTPVLHFATAVGTDLASAAALAGATLRIFGLQSSATEDAMATLAVSTNKSALSFSYLQEAMATVGPVANAFGFSLKDTVALLGALANAGFDSSSAATATRNIILNLADAHGKLATGIGHSVKTFPELIQALRDLKESGVDLNEALEMTDKRSVAAFSSFLDGVDSAEALRDALDDVDGELENISNQRINTVSGSVKLLQSAWEGFILSMSNSKGVIKSTLDFLTRLIEKATKALFPDARRDAMADEYYNTFHRIYKTSGYTKEGLKAQIGAARSAANEQYEIAQAMLNAEEADSEVTGRLQKKLAEAKRRLEALDIAEQKIYDLIAADETDVEDARRKAEITAASQREGDARRAAAGNTADSKKTKVWSLSDDETYSAELLRAKQDLYNGLYATEQDYQNDVLRLEIEAYERRLATDEDSGAARMDLQMQLLDRQTRMQQFGKQKEQASLMSGLDSLYSEEKAAYESHRQDILIRQQEELEDFEGSEKQKEKIKKRHAEEIAKFDEEYLGQLERLLRSMLELERETGQDGLPLLSDADLAKVKKNLSDILKQLGQIKDTTKDGGVFSGNGRGSFLGVSQEQWDNLFENLRQGKMAADDLVSSIDAIGGVASEAFSLASQYTDMLSAKEEKQKDAYEKGQDEQKKSLKKRLDSGLITQAQYEDEIQEMEDDADAYNEELALKQAKREKKLNIAEAIINTALGVTKTLAEFGIPAGIAPAAIMSALGAAQVALMSSTPITTGYASGGVVRSQDGRRFNARLSPDARGFISSPTVLVGEEGGEYVIPASGLANPTLAPFINTIETARINGKLKSLNFSSIYAAGKAEGGYTGSAKQQSGQTTNNYDDVLAALSEIIENMSKPVQATVSLLGKGGVKDVQDKYLRLRNKGKL